MNGVDSVREKESFSSMTEFLAQKSVKILDAQDLNIANICKILGVRENDFCRRQILEERLIALRYFRGAPQTSNVYVVASDGIYYFTGDRMKLMALNFPSKVSISDGDKGGYSSSDLLSFDDLKKFENLLKKNGYSNFLESPCMNVDAMTRLEDKSLAFTEVEVAKLKGRMGLRPFKAGLVEMMDSLLDDLKHYSEIARKREIEDGKIRDLVKGIISDVMNAASVVEE